MADILAKIKLHQAPETQYFKEESVKDQIYVHHTASSGNPNGVLGYWNGNEERVGTAFLIPRGKGADWAEDDIYQYFGSKYWGWHLGLKNKHLLNRGRSSKDMNKKSIGIEICNWGQVVPSGQRYRTYAGSFVEENDIVSYPNKFRGYQFYQKYTDAQLESTRGLLIYLCERFAIEKTFKGMEIFDIDSRCLLGENGIFTHVSCRPDKFDMHPQPELIQMLSSL